MELLSDFFFSEKYCFYRNVAAVVGTLYLGRLLLCELSGFCSGFRAFFLAPMGLGRTNLRKYGAWAVVTGASDGIGRAYALELAKRGLNVVLMSRSEEKLSKVATEIKDNFGRETLVIPVDFYEHNIYASLADQLKNLDIGILINNVGSFYEYPNLMGDVSPEKLYKLVQVNCQPVVQISRIVVPHMVSKGGGIIVNISSASSIMTVPMVSVYCATKIFVNYISDGLRKEYGSKGIIVQNVTPFVVATAMVGITRGSFISPSPSTYVRAAVATIGVQRNTYGCFSHAIQGYGYCRSPQFILDPFIYRELDIHRERLLKYQEKSNRIM